MLRIRNKGAAIALLVLWSGALLIPSTGQVKRQPTVATSEQQQHAHRDEKGPPFFASLSIWIDRNRDTIEAGSTFVVALFTIVLGLSTVALWRATKAIVADARIGREHTERAYVKMSHKRGLSIHKNGQVQMSVEIKNFGRTPARVTDIVLKIGRGATAGDLPPSPDYSEPGKPIPKRAFLVAGDWFFHHVLFGADRKALDEARAGKFILWVYGYVDYVDVFDGRHRFGYGRIYGPLAEDLVFIPSDAYNYDRGRVLGEGIDWPNKKS